MLEAGKTYTIKLNSGEELVAKVTGTADDKFITVTDPVSIAPSQKGMQLIPSMFTADQASAVTINTNSIAMYAETEDSVKMKYIEMTTGIQVPDKSIIMG
jgi:hypothetical protein